MTAAEPTIAPNASVSGWSIWWWLRITITTVFGLLTLATLLLWVRSNSWRDILRVPIGNQPYAVATLEGYISVSCLIQAGPLQLTSARTSGHPYDFPRLITYGDARATFPIWIPALVFAVAAAVPWMLRRFSIRSLLIATTVIALALGTSMGCLTIEEWSYPGTKPPP